MKNALKKAISILLVAVMVFGSAPLAGFVGLELPEFNLFSTKAEAATYSGTCGEDLAWTLDTETGELVLIGTGSTGSYWNCKWDSQYAAPWYPYRENIKKVVINEGINRIGDCTFYDCQNLKSVTIPKSVTVIGDDAFIYCPNLTDVYYTGNIGGWCEIDFGYWKSNPMTFADKLYINGILLEGDIVIPDGVKSINYDAFCNCRYITSISIPNSVTSIGDCAFSGCTSLERVTIGKSVTSIGYDAFTETGYYNDEINWENDVLYIGNYLIRARESLFGEYQIKAGTKIIADDAFSCCDNFTGIIIPDSVTRIGSGAFSSCTSLINVEIGNGVTSIGGDAFWETGYYNDETNWENDALYVGNYFIGLKESFSGECLIKEGTLTFADGMFMMHSNFTSITIPDSVIAVIGENMFRGCDNLESVTIGNNVTSIGDSAFCDCANLTTVTIGNRVTSIGDYAFSNCDNLESVTIGNSVASIGDDAFYNCSRLVSVTISDSVTTPDSVTIPDSEKSIGHTAFYGCSSLVSITIPDGVTSISYGAFHGCSSLARITIPVSVTSIGDTAFFYCKNPTVYYPGTPEQWEKITIGPNYNHSISKIVFECNSKRPYYGAGACGENVIWKLYTDGELTISGTGAMADWLYIDRPWYDYCSLVKTVTISDGVTNVGDRICCFFENLTTINIPDSVTSIGEETFAYCASLTNITIPDSVTSIGDHAFLDCSSLESLTIPDSVMSIGCGAFYNCLSLESVTIPDGVTSIYGYTFIDCTSLKSITIPESVTSIEESAFCRCFNLESVTIPKSVKSIKGGAFYRCSNLNDVYYGGSRSDWRQIDIGDANRELTSANIHYNSVDDEIPDIPDYDPSVADVTTVETPTVSTINYGDSIVLHVDPSKIPEGGYVEWYPSNGNFGYSVSADGTTCKITSSTSGDTTFTALIYDAEGNIVSADTQTMTSKAGFFDKIIAFF
ncbi:MAG: leucine-rich repeat domain-containing protein, partial [Clostridia bacterium]|nr:leucine-rich repeat domain-containing protein [Clostridia bacterium]